MRIASCSNRVRAQAREKSASGDVLSEYVVARRSSATKDMSLFQQPAKAPLQLGKRLRALFVAAFAAASLSAEICSTLFHCSRDSFSFAAIAPKSAVH